MLPQRAAGEIFHVYRFIIHAVSLSYAEAFKYPVRNILADAASGELAYGGHRFLRLGQHDVGRAAVVHGGKGGVHALKRTGYRLGLTRVREYLAGRNMRQREERLYGRFEFVKTLTGD